MLAELVLQWLHIHWVFRGVRGEAVCRSDTRPVRSASSRDTAAKIMSVIKKK